MSRFARCVHFRGGSSRSTKWALCTTGDLHLSLSVAKPMDVFGPRWENYTEKIKAGWENTVGENDTVLVAGDISWAMNAE